jgi:hypothetical protein
VMRGFTAGDLLRAGRYRRTTERSLANPFYCDLSLLGAMRTLRSQRPAAAVACSPAE